MITRGTVAWLVAAALALPLAGCGEKPQSAGGAAALKKADSHAWEGAQAVFTDPGWKAGDKAAWEAHLKARVERGQNEYPRTGSASQ